MSKNLSMHGVTSRSLSTAVFERTNHASTAFGWINPRTPPHPRGEIHPKKPQDGGFTSRSSTTAVFERTNRASTAFGWITPPPTGRIIKKNLKMVDSPVVARRRPCSNAQPRINCVRTHQPARHKGENHLKKPQDGGFTRRSSSTTLFERTNHAQRW